MNTFIGEDEKIKHVMRLAAKVADTPATVLITGETGTGKEIVARHIHRKSSLNECPLVIINCGAIAENIQESELFGHEKGAFTGAESRKKGKFEIAHNGTIFLDEINEMSLKTQVKLLRILQTGEYSPVGCARSMICNVRVIAATNGDLLNLIKKNQFRKDLYYRLNIIRLDLPPLRERKKDIPLLIDFFVRKYSFLYKKSIKGVCQKTLDTLLNYNYPGNVRELENIIIRLVLLSDTFLLSYKDLPDEVTCQGAVSQAEHEMKFHEAKTFVIEEFERKYLNNILKIFNGVISRSASFSGLSERNFHEKLRKYNISAKQYRPPESIDIS